MKTLPEEIVAEAFALSNARGADLLVRLGAYRVWQGDLAGMRGDDPREMDAINERQETAPAGDELLDTLRLVRAIELLQPSCRAALAAQYGEKDASSGASGQRMTTECEQRLLEIYESLATSSPTGAATVPQWMSERERAVAGGRRQR